MYTWINEQKKLKWETQAVSEEEDTKYSTAVLYLLNMPSESVGIQKKLDLLRSLDVAKTVDAAEIEIDSLDIKSHPDSFAELMDLGVVDDSLSSYEFMTDCDWEVKKAYLLKSKKAEQYIPTDDFSADEIQNILLDSKFESTELYHEIIKRFDSLYEKFDHDQLFELVEHYIKNNVDNTEIDRYVLITPPVLDMIASESGIERLSKLADLGVDKTTIQRSLKSIFEQRHTYTLQEYRDFLEKIGSRYADVFESNGQRIFYLENNQMTHEFIKCMNAYSQEVVKVSDFLNIDEKQRNTAEGRVKVSRRIATWNKLNQELLN